MIKKITVTQKKKESKHINTKKVNETQNKRIKKVKRAVRQAENNQMAIVNPPLSIITLNVTVFNLTIKRQRVADWIFLKKIQ